MSDAVDVPPGKREALESLLPHGDVLLQLDPRVVGVQVPARLSQQPLLVLRIGRDMPVPIPDLELSSTGVSATLSFNREPHACRIPWDAVFGMISEDGRALLWAEDVPGEVVEQLARRLVAGPPAQEPDATDAPRLVALDGGRRGEEPEPGDTPEDPPRLRLVE